MPQRPLTSKERLVALLLATGAKPSEVATELGVSQGTISHLRKRQDIQDEEARQRDRLFASVRQATVEKVTAHFDQYAPMAADTITNLAQGAEKESVRLAAAKETLEQGSVGQARRLEKRPPPGHGSSLSGGAAAIIFPAELLQLAFTAAQEIGLAHQFSALSPTPETVPIPALDADFALLPPVPLNHTQPACEPQPPPAETLTDARNALALLPEFEELLKEDDAPWSA